MSRDEDFGPEGNFETKNLPEEKFDKKDEGGPQPGPRPPAYSMNNRLVLETYAKEGLKANVQNGFAMVEQKVSVKGLKVLMNTQISINGVFSWVNKGDTAYVREEYLHSQPWAQKRFKSDAVEGDFMIVDAQYVEFVVPK